MNLLALSTLCFTLGYIPGANAAWHALQITSPTGDRWVHHIERHQEVCVTGPGPHYLRVAAVGPHGAVALGDRSELSAVLRPVQ